MSKTGEEEEKAGKKRPFLVSVEGNVGSGKSTMLNFFKDIEGVKLCPEPVNKWWVPSIIFFKKMNL